jgi:hypothetical protein
VIVGQERVDCCLVREILHSQVCKKAFSHDLEISARTVIKNICFFVMESCMYCREPCKEWYTRW